MSLVGQDPGCSGLGGKSWNIQSCHGFVLGWLGLSRPLAHAFISCVCLGWGLASPNQVLLARHTRHVQHRLCNRGFLGWGLIGYKLCVAWWATGHQHTSQALVDRAWDTQSCHLAWVQHAICDCIQIICVSWVGPGFPEQGLA